MIELRWVRPNGTTTAPDKLQYRVLFYPMMIASGDIVLRVDKTAEWVDVPVVIEPPTQGDEG